MRNNFLILILLPVLCSISSNAQMLSKRQSAYLLKNTKTISSDETVSNTKWEQLADQVKDKRIVLIGELNHGSKEIFQFRNDLIRYLHDKHGFTTILFESGIGELVIPDMRRNELGLAQMTAGLVGSWRTPEFRDLMEYVRNKNISIAGFDVQRTGGSFRSLLYEIAIKENIDTAFCDKLEERYGSVMRELNNRKTEYDSVEQRTNELVGDYQKLYEQLDKRRSITSSKAFLFSLRTISNRIIFLQYMLKYAKDKDLHSRWAARDRAMAANIRWLVDSVYENEKLVIVAHNFHIARYNDNEEVMGELLSTAYSNKMYAIGVFAGKGSYADNSGKEVNMTAPDTVSLDIKHIIEQLPGFASFIKIPRKRSAYAAWLYNDIIVNDTFIDLKGSNKMILSKKFDGLLLLRKISAAKP